MCAGGKEVPGWEGAWRQTRGRRRMGVVPGRASGPMDVMGNSGSGTEEGSGVAPRSLRAAVRGCCWVGGRTGEGWGLGGPREGARKPE